MCGAQKKTDIGELCRPCTNLSMRTDTQHDYCVDCGKKKPRNQYKRCKSCATKKDWETKEFREKQASTNKWSDDRRKEHSARIKELWDNDEEFRSAIVSSVKERMSSPEGKKEAADRMKSRWEDDEYREERIQSALDMWDDPEMREKILLARDGFILDDDERRYPEEFGNRLREKIRNRERRHCALCGKPESSMKHRLHVHHIDADKNNSAESNLIALCRKCHGLVGRKKTRPYWQQYLSFYIASRFMPVSPRAGK